MKQWPGMERNTADAGDGCLFVANAFYHKDGEIQRRHGLTLFTNQSGRTMRGFRAKTGEYFTVFCTDAGTVVSVAT